MSDKWEENWEFFPDERMASEDRRRRPRYQLRCTVHLKSGNRQLVAETQNISSEGLYCLSPLPLEPGELVAATLEFPGHGGLSNSGMSLDLKLTVIRVEPQRESGKFGIACLMKDYQVHRALQDLPGLTPIIN